MASKKAKKLAHAKRREAVKASDRVGPTPETVAKLQPDPFNEMVKAKVLDDAQRAAGLEIRAVYLAIIGPMLARGGNLLSTRAGGDISPMLAAAHAQRYIPWCDKWGRRVSAVFDLINPEIVRDGQFAVFPKMLERPAAIMLRDYARRMRIPLDMAKAA